MLGSGFRLFHNLYRVDVIDFEDTWLSTLEIVNNASPQYEIWGFASATIDLTMCNNILLLFLSITFCCRVLGMLYCVPIPFSSHKSLNYFDKYSLPWFVLYVLIFLSNRFSTKLMLCLKQSNVSNVRIDPLKTWHNVINLEFIIYLMMF